VCDLSSDDVRFRWDNDEVEKLSPWDLEPLEDCSMLKLTFPHFYIVFVFLITNAYCIRDASD